MRSGGGEPSKAPPSELNHTIGKGTTVKSMFLDVRKLQRWVDAVYAASLAKFKLSPLEAHVLAVLHTEGPMMASQLAQRVNYGITSFTSPLDQLQERGLLERQPHATDRRAVLIDLTEAGRELFPALTEALDGVHDTVCADIADERHPAHQFMQDFTEGQPF